MSSRLSICPELSNVLEPLSEAAIVGNDTLRERETGCM